MELRALAEQILFSSKLEDKLSCPEVVTDDHPGKAILAPSTPHRPDGLQFKEGRSSEHAFPGMHRIEREDERGKLLHFFANHELLATELMALVLLRFPDAPTPFRRGVLATLRDEQEHTRMYLQRMAECGIRFGEIPVSGYFWRSVSGMENPIDYVSGLSLTFEQANLDFCRQFAAAFHHAGDADTGKLLDRIYRDEIAHVAYGLKWFRRWKNPSESDWEAFCKQLRFPLSPNRAKGPVLNKEGRRAAGFDAEFIDQLQVYSQSKGRTPSVFLFNPWTEGYLAYGRGFTPVKHLEGMKNDLRNLPMFLCRQDDVVLTSKKPSVAFLSRLRALGFPLPEWVECQGPDSGALRSLAERKIGRLRPWAWGPDSLNWLTPLEQSLTGESGTVRDRFHDGIAELYSKGWSAQLMSRVNDRFGEKTWLLPTSGVGKEVASIDYALASIKHFRSTGFTKLVVKQTFGLAGQSALRLWESELLPNQIRWMENSLAQGVRLVVEPWLERLVDFSLQLEMDPHRLRILGYTGLLNDARGQFIANWAEAGWQRRFPVRVTQTMKEAAVHPQDLHELYRAVIDMLEAELLQRGFRGALGIDAFVYRRPEGGVALKPVVEINPRYTMGRLTLELMQQVSPGGAGMFRIVSDHLVRKEGHAGLAAFAAHLESKFPVERIGSPVARLLRGAFPLVDPAEAECCLPYFQVQSESNLEQLLPL